MAQRITIRLDDALHEQLLLFARGRSNGQTPDVSAIVREALAQYLRPKPCQTNSTHMSDKKQRPVRHG